MLEGKWKVAANALLPNGSRLVVVNLILIVGALGIFVGATGAQLASDNSWFRFFDNIHWTSGTMSSAIISLLALKHARPENESILLWISLGLSAYAIGQILWDVQTVIGYAQFPSPADLFYIWLGPCVTIGLVSVIRSLAAGIEFRSIILDTLLLFTSALTLTLVEYLEIRDDVGILAMTFLTAYPTTLLLATITGIAMIATLRLRANASIILLIVSTGLTGLSWMKWNAMTLSGEIIDGAWFNSSFSIAVFVLGMVLPRWEISQSTSDSWNRGCDYLTRLIPVLSMALVFIAVIKAEDRGELLETLAIAGMMLVVMLAAVRHLLQLNERDNLLATQKSLLLSKEALIEERRKAEHDLRLASVAFESQEGIMITDANGVILRVNKALVETTGYSADELLGNTPRILKSGRHDENFYRAMWASINLTGSWTGEIWDRRKNGELYPKWLTITAVRGDDGAVSHYVGSQIDITDRKAAEEQIQDLAFYDFLTRLPNRRLLIDRLQHALASSSRSGRSGALLFIDLDDFKSLNDTLGHDVGDMLLKQVADRLKACVREDDTVARLGGDEFVVVLEVLNGDLQEAASQTNAIGEKLLAAMSEPFQVNGHDCRSSSSIGATLFCGMQSSIEELMKQADIAMYQAKKSGRHSLLFFDSTMQDNLNVHAALEAELHDALASDNFLLYYQPQVCKENLIIGAEALIRWNNPKRGMVSPAQFIPVAEETGLILPMGAWVLDTACRQIKAWETNKISGRLAVAVNVSAKQFRQEDFVDQVRTAVLRNGINPTLLELELTEGVVLNSIEETIQTMNKLNDIGIRLSLDDFGTGYSSLQYLKRLPLDQLKIDQSFVRDITVDKNDMAIVRTIIAMARSMNLDVIAEGVETEEQHALLLEMGCENFQGYLFGKPLPISQFNDLLKHY
jgi:diguanylate cyclase (GGDEF)-like protein/PAS domain S-box-containing protein